MTSSERRLADRVEVGFPAQLYARGRSMRSDVRDLSRTGVRVRVEARDLGFEPTRDMRATAEGVAAALTPSFALDLHCDRLGALVKREVDLVRIGLPAGNPTLVELCCEFDAPLADEEAGFLETELPSMREDAEPDWVPAENMPAEPCHGTATLEPLESATATATATAAATRTKAAPVLPSLRPRQRYRALVSGTRRSAPPALFCHTDLVTGFGVRIVVPREDYGASVSMGLALLHKRYGTSMDLKLVHEGNDVWNGPARVTGLELPVDMPEEMRVTLAFDRPLALHEMRTLGLLKPTV